MSLHDEKQQFEGDLYLAIIIVSIVSIIGWLVYCYNRFVSSL